MKIFPRNFFEKWFQNKKGVMFWKRDHPVWGIYRGGVRNFGKKIPGNFFLEKGSYGYLTPSFGVGRGVYGGVKKGAGGLYNLLTK
jgi:hypothetical protein